MEINAFDAKECLKKTLEKTPKPSGRNYGLFLVDHRDGEVMQVYDDEDEEVKSSRYKPDFLFQVTFEDDGSHEIALYA